MLSCLQYGLSRMIGYLRGKTVTVSDQRVRLMTEILSHIRFIKMYAWEKCFTKVLLSKSSGAYLILFSQLSCLQTALILDWFL
jgi:hypothetical protein